MPATNERHIERTVTEIVFFIIFPSHKVDLFFFWAFMDYPSFSPATDLLSTETMAHEHRKYMTLSLMRWPGYNGLRPVFVPFRILTWDTRIASKTRRNGIPGPRRKREVACRTSL